MAKISFVNEKIELEVPDGCNMREEARKAGVEMHPSLARYLNCFGHGQCGTCRVLVKDGKDNLSKKGMIEKFTLFRMLSSVGHEEEMRLACQCKVNGDVKVVTRPAMNISGEVFWQKPYPNK